jgi:outer membrane lipoprotein-sorting protein
VKRLLAPLLCFWAATAQALSVPEIQSRIAEQDKKLKAVSFEYVQELRSEGSAETVKSTGKAYFSKPKSLRVEQKLPEAQMIVSSGKHVYIYTPRFKQVLRDSWSRWARQNSFLPGMFGSAETLDRLKKDFSWKVGASETVSSEKTIKVQLVENIEADPAQVLYLWLGEQDFIPRKAEFKRGTLSMTMSLVALKVNPELDPKLFKFSAPKDAQVVDVP